MDIKIYGKKICLKTIFVSIIVGIILSYFTLCPCLKINAEFFTNPSKKDYVLGDNVPMNRWTSSNKNYDIQERPMYSSLKNNIGGSFPLPKKNLAFFFDTPFHGECCNTPLKYTSSNGCACISSEQDNFLKTRGGNNNVPSFL